MLTRFMLSAGTSGDFPRHDVPEVAFVGRSNVGKSSLLNSLTGTKIARTSRTPGRTQLINFFEVKTKKLTYVLADLPGYGFAKAPKSERAKWKVLIESYLVSREPLRAVLLLFDVRREVDAEDAAFHAELVETLGARQVGIELVVTKTDKVAKAQLKPALHAIARGFGIPNERVIGTSAAKKLGLGDLRGRIERLVRHRDTDPGHPRPDRLAEPDADREQGARADEDTDS